MEYKKRFGLGVVIHIFNKDFSKILLIKRNKEKRELNKTDWGSVGGRVEWGEKLIGSCVRETKEEIGINLNPEKIKLIEIREITKNQIAPEVHFLQFIYSTIADENEKISLNHESDEYGWFDLDNLPDKMLDTKEKIIKIKRIIERGLK